VPTKKVSFNVSAPIGIVQECSGWNKAMVEVTWDTTKTTVTGMRLVILRAYSDRDPIDLKVRLNGTEVFHFFWGEGTKGTVKSDVRDVTINNGSNTIEVRACKHYYWPGNVHTDVAGYLEVTYEGEAPVGRGSVILALKKYWWALLIPAGIIGGVVLGKYRTKS